MHAPTTRSPDDRLTEFELYMLADDRPTHPMTFYIRLDFSGTILASRVRAALHSALRRHPLLTSKVRGDIARHEVAWEQVDAMPFFSIADASVDLEFPQGERIDLQSEPGLRVWLRSKSQESRLYFQFHHACCDGLGAFAFIRDLLIAYDGLCGGDAARKAPEPSTAEVGACRGVQGTPVPPTPAPPRTGRGLRVAHLRNPWLAIRQWKQTIVELARGLRFLIREAWSVNGTGRQTASSALQRHAALLTHTVPAEVVEALRRVAHDQQTSLNSLLLRDYFLALHTWRKWNPSPVNPGSNRMPRSEILRVIVPMDLRDRDVQQQAAANKVVMQYLDRNARDCRHPEKLLTGITSALRSSSRAALRDRLTYAVRLLRLLGIDLRKLLRGRRCLTTSVFSNLGAPLDNMPLHLCDGKLVVGTAKLESLEIVPPLRPLTNVSMVTASCAGQLHVFLHYNRQVLTRIEAGDLLEAMAAQLAQSAAGRVPAWAGSQPTDKDRTALKPLLAASRT